MNDGEEPELSGLWLVLVAEWLLDIVGGVKLRWLLGRSCRLSGGIMSRESSAVLSLDSP